MLIKASAPSWALSRRTFLRGSLGTAVALPFLDAMTWDAKAQAAPRPRFLSFYVPCGMHMRDFTPSGEGALGALPSILQPLESVKSAVTVVTGLANEAGFAGGDGPGDHARGTGTFLTCRRLLKSTTEIRNGVSVDQVMAQHLRAQGFPGLSSLELGCEGGGSTGNCDSGYSCAYSVNIAWAGVSSPLPKETNPRSVFDRLFAGTDPTATQQERETRRLYRQSVLDVVKGDANRLKAQLGTKDQQKLEEHLTGVRELERQLDDERVAVCTPGNRPESGAPSNPTTYVRTMLDLVVNAFACDRTRVATFMLGNGGSSRNYSFIGVNGAHHELSHHQSDANKQRQLSQIDRWEVEQLAYVLEKLRSVDDGGQTLLDRSMVFFGSEIEDGNSHNHANLPVIVGGRGGGLIAGGQHRRVNRRPIADLFLTALDVMQVPATSFADSGARLSLA